MINPQTTMTWQPIKTYKGGKAILYFPTIKDERCPSNSLSAHIQVHDIPRWGARNASHWMPLPEKPND